MELEALTEQNPWWRGKKLIENDEDIRKWRAGKIKWLPDLLQKISLKPFALHFVFGPRQVGKTTLLKLLIKKLLEDGVNEKSLFYFKCDKLLDFKELDDVLKTFFEFKKSNGIKTSYIFLDEVTFSKEWHRAIKYHIDVGNLKNDVVIVTGSLSMFLKREIELFPGRRGNGKDYIMLPLSFREFIKVFDKKLHRSLPSLQSLDKKEIFKKAYEILPFFEKIQKLFKNYLKVGGFPLAVKNVGITDDVKEAYWAWVRGDLAKIKRSEETLKRIAKAILEKSGSAISLNSIAKEFEIGTHKTVYEYLDVMEKLFMVKVLYWLDPNKLIPNFKKNRKIYFIDPFFYYLFSDLCFTKLPDESIMVESVVVSHLAKEFEVFYWKNRREVDVIVKDDNFLKGIEVKWKKSSLTDFSKVKIGRVKEVIGLTKNELDKEKNLLPVSLFLSLL